MFILEKNKDKEPMNKSCNNPETKPVRLREAHANPMWDVNQAMWLLC